MAEQLIESPTVQRPRSALHAGDFTLDHEREEKPIHKSPFDTVYSPATLQSGFLGTSLTTPWYTPPSSFPSLKASHPFSPQDNTHDTRARRSLRSRAPSLNTFTSSSYVLKAPTTPLVHQSNNTDLDLSSRENSISPEKNNRRRTLPPHAFQDSHENKWSSPPHSPRRTSSYRREAGIPFGHQPRRSLTSNWSLQASSSPQTPPHLRSRRTSINTESSPLQHASMVGSYEESILRGWMSTAPSRPLEFTAQIGVLGKGNCKPKCPPHVTFQFPAVYYSWNGGGGGRNIMSDDPSPYVGHINLQQPKEQTETSETLLPDAEVANEPSVNGVNDELEGSALGHRNRGSKKRRRNSPSSKPHRGSYRIPQQGQLQIIIKNPNKTAVKLFLVPYDLNGMEPGTKTFVRQRSYSSDAVMDGSLVQRASSDAASLSQKAVLRYLIHLNICSPARGRYYLYSQIRVVFANRVPDNKEHLRNEIQVPQPRFSPYKPNRETLLGPSSSSGVKLAAEKAYQRRSSGSAFGVDELDGRKTQTFTGGSIFPLSSGPVSPIPAIPLNVGISRQRPAESSRVNDADVMEVDNSRSTTSDGPQSPLSDRSTRFIGMQFSGSYKSNSSQGSEGYNKLSKGEAGYGGFFGRPQTPEPGEGLLARRLKGLGVQRDFKPAEENA